MTGVPTVALSDEDLYRELGHLFETRLETLRHGSAESLATHTLRSRALEQEYLRRLPEREIDSERLRSGARARV